MGIYFKNIQLSDEKIPPNKYWHTRGKGGINASEFGTGTVTVMVKPGNINSSEKISGHNAATNTRDILRTDKFRRTYSRRPSIHGIHGRISGRLRRIVCGGYRRPEGHSLDIIIDP